jgi:hypothetical protein
VPSDAKSDKNNLLWGVYMVKICYFNYKEFFYTWCPMHPIATSRSAIVDHRKMVPVDDKKLLHPNQSFTMYQIRWDSGI